MKIASLSELSDQNLVTNPQCYKDRQNRSILFSVSMITLEKDYGEENFLIILVKRIWNLNSFGTKCVQFLRRYS